VPIRQAGGENSKVMAQTLENISRSLGSELLDILGVLARVVISGILAFFIGRYVSRFVERLMTKRSLGFNGALLFGKLSVIVVWIIWLSWTLSSLGANTTGLVAVVGASTVAISLSLQDILKNFVAGIFLLLERPFRVGDRIKVKDVVGEVQGVDIRTTLIRNSEGALVMIPNATIFTEILVNRSHFRTRRLDLLITTDRKNIVEIDRRIREGLSGVPGIRNPIPAPTVRSSTPQELVMNLSVLIESTPEAERTVLQHLIDTLGDSRLEVIRT